MAGISVVEWAAHPQDFAQIAECPSTMYGPHPPPPALIADKVRAIFDHSESASQRNRK